MGTFIVIWEYNEKDLVNPENLRAEARKSGSLWLMNLNKFNWLV